MRLASVLVLFIALPTILESKFFHRFTKIECNSSMKSVTKPYCFIKAYNRKYPMMNVGFTLTRKIPNGKADYSNGRKTSMGSYEMTMNFMAIDTCKHLSIEKEPNPFQLMMINLAKTLEGNVLGVCSTIGDIKVSNISYVNSTILRLFPAGDYKTNFKFFDDIDDNIMNVTYYHTVSH